MTYFVLVLAFLALSVTAIGLVRTVHHDRPRHAPHGPSYWASSNLPSSPFAS